MDFDQFGLPDKASTLSLAQSHASPQDIQLITTEALAGHLSHLAQFHTGMLPTRDNGFTQASIHDT